MGQYSHYPEGLLALIIPGEQPYTFTSAQGLELSKVLEACIERNKMARSVLSAQIEWLNPAPGGKQAQPSLRLRDSTNHSGQRSILRE